MHQLKWGSTRIKSEPEKISWAAKLKRDLDKQLKHEFDSSFVKTCIYRPFSKSKIYYAPSFIERPGLMDVFFPTKSIENKLICVSGVGSNNPGITLMVDTLIDYNSLDAGAKCFPLYYYEEREKNSPSLFDAASENEYIRRDGVSDFILERAKKVYGKNVGKEDIFYYVYGILHSQDYRAAFANDLKKMLPRLPLVEDVKNFWAFSKAGRKLAELHINYEEVPPYDGVEISETVQDFQGREDEIPQKKKETIIYNSRIQISNIPAKLMNM